IADDGCVLLFVLVVACSCALGGAVVRRSSGPRPGRIGHGARRRPIGTWLSIPAAPRATTADDDWVLEAFDADEIAELRLLDAEVRHDLARDHHAVVLARVPD